jgi:hypothetical protein
MGTILVRIAALTACALALAQSATAAPKLCPAQGNQCTVQLQLVNGAPAVTDDPIVIEQGKHLVHINWRAPRGWEFVDGGVRLKDTAGASQFDQWCATDVDNDECTTRKPRGRQYHCRAHNSNAGAHRYELRLRNTATGAEQHIDPVIINKGS